MDPCLELFLRSVILMLLIALTLASCSSMGNLSNASQITSAMRCDPVALFSSFSLGLHADIVPHFANQRLLDNFGLHWKQNCSFVTSLPLPPFELSHSIEVRTSYTD